MLASCNAPCVTAYGSCRRISISHTPTVHCRYRTGTLYARSIRLNKNKRLYQLYRAHTLVMRLLPLLLLLTLSKRFHHLAQQILRHSVVAWNHTCECIIPVCLQDTLLHVAAACTSCFNNMLHMPRLTCFVATLHVQFHSCSHFLTAG